MGIANELGLVQREVLQEERSQVSIFSKVQQVLHVQGIDAVLRVVLDHLVGYQKWFVGIGSPQAIERETTRQTGNRSEQTLESLSHVMRDEVLVDLDTH